MLLYKKVTLYRGKGFIMEKTKDNNLTVEQAFKILEQEKITPSVQVFRRWLRDGKIKGAYKESKKHGYIISEQALNEYINAFKDRKVKAKEKIDSGDYQKGFNEGYAKGIEELKARERYLITSWPSMYERQEILHRADIREKAKKLLSTPEDQKKFMQYLDSSLFSKTTKTPKSKVYINILGSWLFIEDTRELFSEDELELDNTYEKMDRFAETWIERRRKEFIKINK